MASAWIERVFHDPKIVAGIPVIAVCLDYALTFILSGSLATILELEASPLVRYAVAHNIIGIYIAVLLVFYYFAAYIVLRLLEKSPLYGAGVALIVLLSLTHLMGGLSWVFRNPIYPNTVIGLSFISIAIAIGIFVYALLKGELHAS